MSTNIVDISGVGLKQFWNLKSHMQAASQLATANYPETLDRIFIIGAPMFFSTVWGWIKRWFDPITVSKIFILDPHEVRPVLESFIEPRNIPKKYGGELEFKFGELGIPDPAWEGVIEWEKGYSSFPTGPLLWEETDDGKRVACFMHGKEKGQARYAKICSLPKAWPPPTETVDEKNNAQQTTATNGIDSATATATETSEGTQTAEPESRDDGVQTDEALSTADVVEKLKLTEKTPTEPIVAPSIPTATA